LAFIEWFRLGFKLFPCVAFFVLDVLGFAGFIDVVFGFFAVL
jgi:hypothetical protein